MSIEQKLKDRRGYYENSSEKFHRILDFSIRLSHLSGGHKAPRLVVWGAAIFTRCCTTGMSISVIQDNEKSGFLDCFSIATLSRSIIDSCIMFIYLVEDADTETEIAKLDAIDIHDFTSRRRMFGRFPEIVDKGELEATKKLMAERKFRLSSSKAIDALPQDQRERLLNGQDAFIGGMRGVIKRAGWDRDRFELVHTYLSQHVHSLPVSFHRIDTNNIDFEDPSAFQLFLAGFALEHAAESLGSACKRMMEVLAKIAEGDEDWLKAIRAVVVEGANIDPSITG